MNEQAVIVTFLRELANHIERGETVVWDFADVKDHGLNEHSTYRQLSMSYENADNMCFFTTGILEQNFSHQEATWQRGRKS